MTVLGEDDRLLLLVINKLDFLDPKVGEKWSGFDGLFLEAARKLEGGYVNTFYYDCLWIDQ